MILPARPLLYASACWFALGLACAWQADWLLLWQVAGGALASWAVADFFLCRWQVAPAAQRVINHSLPLGVWSAVDIRLHFSGTAPRHIEIYDLHPADCAQRGLPGHIKKGTSENSFLLRYGLRPLKRGKHHFAGVGLRWASPLAAWQRDQELPLTQEIKVYPNFSPLASQALRAADPRQAMAGLHMRRRRGQGMDFAQLREYREGDSMRQVDWKASTRVGRMISREYQDERDQRVLLMIDCGRRMASRDGELSHFDHALDAVLMLAYVAQSHGDYVGLQTLGGPERYLPAQRKGKSVARVLNALYDLHPSLQSSDFLRSAEQLLARERKRALVVIFTSLRDEDTHSLLSACRLLSQRHLVLVASLREAALDEALAGDAQHLHAAARLAAATGYQLAREKTLQSLRAEGVLCLDSPPQKLAVSALNRYLAIKAAQQL